MIEVETPDGGVAEFPDGTPPEVIKNALRKRFPPAQTVASGKGDRERSTGETLGDMGLSAAQGFQTGFQSLLGSLGDAQQIAGNAAAWGAGKLGFSPETQQTARNIGSRVPTMGLALPAPTTEQVNTAFESVIGPKYQPQTKAGEAARSVGEFAPAAMAGPGGVARKTAMAVVPGLAVEATDELTGGNPYAKAGAGIVAGVMTAGRGNAGTKEMLKKVGKTDPAYAKIERQTNDAYNRLRAAGIKYDANGVDRAISEVSAVRMNPTLAPKAVGLRDEFTRFAGRGMDFDDLDELERIGTAITRDFKTDETDKLFTNIILKKIRDIRENGVVATSGNLPANEVNSLIGRAKDLAKRRIIARDIGKMKNKAEWYVSGPESGLRNQFKGYGQKNQRNLSKVEEQAFKRVVNREGALNVLHSVGSRMGQTMMGAAGLYSGQIIPALAGMIGSAAARKLMEVYTRKGVDNAIKTVLAGRSSQEQAAVRDLLSKAEAQARAALTADAAIRNELEPSTGLVGVPR